MTLPILVVVVMVHVTIHFLIGLLWAAFIVAVIE